MNTFKFITLLAVLSPLASSAHAGDFHVGMQYNQFKKNMIAEQKVDLSALGIMANYTVDINDHFVIAPEFNYFAKSTKDLEITDVPTGDPLNVRLDTAISVGVRFAIKDDSGVGFFVIPSHNVIRYDVKDTNDQKVHQPNAENWGIGLGVSIDINKNTALEIRTDRYGDQLKTINTGIVFRF